jgi:hypothetical protein
LTFDFKKLYFPLFLFLFFVVFSLLNIKLVSSAEPYTLEMPLNQGSTQVQGPAAFVRMVFIYGLGLVGIAALFALVYGGFRYMTSGGGSTGVAKGKEWILNALLGIALLLCSYLILYTINPDLVSFREPTLEKITIETIQIGPDSFDPYGVTDKSRSLVINPIASTFSNLTNYKGTLNSQNSYLEVDTKNKVMNVVYNGQIIGSAPINIGTNGVGTTNGGTGTSGDKTTPLGDFSIENVRNTPGTQYFSSEYGSNMGPAVINLSVPDRSGIAIHGSQNDNLNNTAGCIRLHNADAIAVSQVVNNGTTVRIK